MALHPDVVTNASAWPTKHENEFRYEVRMALGMDAFARDDQIVAEVKRLKALEASVQLSR